MQNTAISDQVYYLLYRLFLYPCRLTETHTRGQSTDSNVHMKTGDYQLIVMLLTI